MTATLVYCVGAMAVVGSLNSGLTGEHQVLYANPCWMGSQLSSSPPLSV